LFLFGRRRCPHTWPKCQWFPNRHLYMERLGSWNLFRKESIGATASVWEAYWRLPSQELRRILRLLPINAGPFGASTPHCG
jgi:hypothetical protein